MARINLNSTQINAAHEIGHFYFAHRKGQEMSFVSIVHGSGYDPFNAFDPGQPGLRNDIEFWLGGWAAEAYVRSHKRGTNTFRPFLFVWSAIAARKHAGWGSRSETSDVARLDQAGVSFRVLPFARLLSLGKIIHEDQVSFYKLVDSIQSNYTMSGEWLAAIADDLPVTPEMRNKTLEMTVESYKPRNH